MSFFEAADTLERELSGRGAETIAPGLKVDGDVAEAEDEAKAWAKRIAGLVRT